VANSFATTAVVAKEALAILKNTCAFASMVNRDWEDEIPGNMARGYAPGNTISIKSAPSELSRRSCGDPPSHRRADRFADGQPRRLRHELHQP
jgi:hypothetical protein